MRTGMYVGKVKHERYGRAFSLGPTIKLLPNPNKAPKKTEIRSDTKSKLHTNIDVAS